MIDDAGRDTAAQAGRGDEAPRTVLTDLVDGVAVITLNRPERHNAMDDGTSALAQEAVRWAVDERAARAILLRGAGRSFSSGRDTSQLGQRTPGDSDYQFILRAATDACVLLIEATKPVIGALKGAVLGGACEMALSCDYRVAADDVRMGFPEVGFGIMTDTGGAPLATILAGPSRAKYMLMTGERIGAQQALAWGLVDEVVTPEELDDRSFAVAARLAAGPPLSNAMIKQVVDGVWAGQFRAGLGAELLAQAALFKSADHREAKLAAGERRSPNFTGT